MRSYKRWTNNEDLVVISKVADNSNNLREAFKIAAIELNRSEMSVMQRWYKVLSKRETNAVFMVCTKNTKLVNRKVSNEIPVQVPEGKLKRLLRKLFNK